MTDSTVTAPDANPAPPMTEEQQAFIKNMEELQKAGPVLDAQISHGKRQIVLGLIGMSVSILNNLTHGDEKKPRLVVTPNSVKQAAEAILTIMQAAEKADSLGRPSLPGMPSMPGMMRTGR